MSERASERDRGTICAGRDRGGLGKSNRKGQGKRRRRRGQRGTNLARWSSDWRSIGSERAEKNGRGGVNTGGTGTREGAGQDARQFLHALPQVCCAHRAFAPSVDLAQKEKEEEEKQKPERSFPLRLLLLLCMLARTQSTAAARARREHVCAWQSRRAHWVVVLAVLGGEEHVRKGGDTRRATARVTHALLASSPLTPLSALPGLSPPAHLPFVVLTGCVSSHPAQHVPRARE